MQVLLKAFGQGLHLNLSSFAITSILIPSITFMRMMRRA